MKTYTSLDTIRQDIDSGSLTCVKLTQSYLDRIEKNKNLNAFLEVYTDEALAKAKEVDEKIKAGTAGRLAGMVVGLKDVLCHKDHGLQGASKILNQFVSQFDGTAVKNLIAEDAIIIGRQNCDEFAMGSSNENSAFGNSLNAADNTKVPGGSSGGSAVAVQADLCLVSLGSDTGGSVRQPAAFCGIIGLKPTYSRISRFGLIAYASSFDSIGIFAKGSKEVALTLEVIAGGDEFDSTVSKKPVPKYSDLKKFDKKIRIGVLEQALSSDGVQLEVKQQTEDAINKLKEAGHEVEAFNFKLLDYILPTYYILTTAEASSNLSRYDGVRYGYRSDKTKDVESMYKKSRSEGFGEEVKKRIMLGTFVLSHGYYDAYYTKAQKMRRLIKEETDKLLEKFDFLLMPTTPSTAFKIGEHSEDSLAMYLADLFTVQANLVGVPGISLPMGKDKENMPIGLQFMTKSFGEEELLSFSEYFLRLN